jgi:hypothetical protein
VTRSWYIREQAGIAKEKGGQNLGRPFEDLRVLDTPLKQIEHRNATFLRKRGKLFFARKRLAGLCALRIIPPRWQLLCDNSRRKAGSFRCLARM